MEKLLIATTAHCEMCGLESLVDNWTKELFEGGIVLHLEGYYGAFHDNIDGPVTVLLCHDCTAEIWRKIPKLVALGNNGLHSNLSGRIPNSPAESVCCEFSS